MDQFRAELVALRVVEPVVVSAKDLTPERIRAVLAEAVGRLVNSVQCIVSVPPALDRPRSPDAGTPEKRYCIIVSVDSFDCGEGKASGSGVVFKAVCHCSAAAIDRGVTYTLSVAAVSQESVQFAYPIQQSVPFVPAHLLSNASERPEVPIFLAKTCLAKGTRVVRSS
jgi:hypothetical protein